MTTRIRITAAVPALVAGLAALMTAGEASAFASGSGTCTASAATITGMQTRTRNAPGEGPFSVVVDMMNSTYTPGAEHMVAITSSNAQTFTGLLIYAETTSGMRVGAFDKSDSFIGSPSTSCPGDTAAAASHTSFGPASETTVMIPWTAPATDVGTITFRSIVLGGTRGSTGQQQFYFPDPVELTASNGGGSDFLVNQGISGAWFEQQLCAVENR